MVWGRWCAHAAAVATAEPDAAAVTVAADAGVAAAAWFGGDGWLDAQGPHMACAMSVADSLATGIVAQMWTMEATKVRGHHVRSRIGG